MVKTFRLFHPKVPVAFDAIDWTDEQAAKMKALDVQVTRVQSAGKLPPPFVSMEHLMEAGAGAPCPGLRPLTPMTWLSGFWRLHMVPRVMEATQAPVLWMDTDCIVRADLTGMFESAARRDVAIVQRPESESLDTKVLNSVVYVNASRRGREYLGFWPKLFDELFPKHGWWTDQTIAHVALARAKALVRPLQMEIYNDSLFSPKAAIWHLKYDQRNDPRGTKELERLLGAKV